MLPFEKSNGEKKKPAFLRKKTEAPLPPSDGAEDEAEMPDEMVTCPECGCEFSPESAEADEE